MSDNGYIELASSGSITTVIGDGTSTGTYIDASYSLIKKPPPPAGYFRIADNVQMEIQTKPSWWRRMWSKALLGWEWIDG